MPLHHYLPATFLALFSNDTTGPVRQYKISVGDKKNGHCFSSAVSKIGCVTNLYTLVGNKENPQLVENIWSDYETNLRDAVDKLIRNELDAMTWARVLVPFVAGSLVRSPDAIRRFSDRLRLAGLGRVHVSEDNFNYFRIFELQRLLGPVLAARWIVGKCTDNEELITNDLAHTPFLNPQLDASGLAIPIGKSYVLILIPQRSKRIAYAKEGNWYPYLEFVEIEPSNFRDLKQALAMNAQRFIFGPDASTINLYLKKTDNIPPVADPSELGFISGRLSVVHEFTWHRLVSVLAAHPDSLDSYNFSINPTALASGWCPPMYLPTNLPEFPSSLRRIGNEIHVDFFDIPGFTIEI